MLSPSHLYMAASPPGNSGFCSTIAMLTGPSSSTFGAAITSSLIAILLRSLVPSVMSTAPTAASFSSTSSWFLTCLSSSILSSSTIRRSVTCCWFATSSGAMISSGSSGSWKISSSSSSISSSASKVAISCSVEVTICSSSGLANTPDTERMRRMRMIATEISTHTIAFV